MAQAVNSILHPDRLFPLDEKTRSLARQFYHEIKDLPIISPHGHTDPIWFSENENFTDPVSLLITPDHYVLRMFYSQGMNLEDFGVSTSDQKSFDSRKAWKTFAQNYFLFRATPSALWLNHVFYEVFGLTEALTEKTADLYYDVISQKLASPEYKPRKLYDRFKIEVLATTDAATDTLEHHQRIQRDFPRRIIPTFRPDGCIDPEHPEFLNNLRLLSEITNLDCFNFKNYLAAFRKRRGEFKKLGATASDHGHPSPKTLNLSPEECEALFLKVTTQNANLSAQDAENFRAQMLVEMAKMSLEDGLVMQLHPGSYRNHNLKLFQQHGRDKGADIPMSVEFTRHLKPLLDLVGTESKFKLILFTLDESTYARELAPLAGHYPSVHLGPAWWFHDSPEGMIRHRQQTIETAGFYNTAGFNDDTRAFFSIPARHDLARRIDCRILSQWVMEHRLTEEEAIDTLIDLTTELVKGAYNL